MLLLPLPLYVWSSVPPPLPAPSASLVPPFPIYYCISLGARFDSIPDAGGFRGPFSLVAAGGLVRVTAHMGPHNPREAPPCVVSVRGVGMVPPLGSAQGLGVNDLPPLITTYMTPPTTPSHLCAHTPPACAPQAH